MSDVAGLGLKILVTEMDVSDLDLPGDISLRDRMVAGVYEDILAVMLDEPALVGVNTWGLSDKYTWISWFAPRNDGTSVRPLPCNCDMQRKLAWKAIARAFDNTQKRKRSSKLWNAWKKLRDEASE